MKKKQGKSTRASSNRSREEKTIALERIFLDGQNPRHEEMETQAEIIEYLCDNEEIQVLARDIVENGVSPIERFGVVPDNEESGDDATYVIAEGNRRICALKLLTDPDLAPSSRRPYFRKLSESWTPIKRVPCVIFFDEDDLRLWLERRHHGYSGGLGQKPWNAEQKSRHAGTNSRNERALRFLDYAEKSGLISPEERKGKLTTVQRFLGNPVMREAMGIDSVRQIPVSRVISADDFELLSKQFIADLLADIPRVTSRMNSEEINQYARELYKLPGVTRDAVESEPIDEHPKKQKGKKSKKKKPPKPRTLTGYQNIEEALDDLGSWKLINLYWSICHVPLEGNVPLLAVGLWSFLETLTARAGRADKTDFLSFLSKNRLKNHGLGNAQKINRVWNAVKNVQVCGNTTKHDDTAAHFNGDQLNNDLELLTGLILKEIEAAIAKK